MSSKANAHRHKKSGRTSTLQWHRLMLLATKSPSFHKRIREDSDFQTGTKLDSHSTFQGGSALPTCEVSASHSKKKGTQA